MFLFAIFILGICLGSFVSAFSWRYPRSISVIKGRSLCPNCKHRINWYDNIPLLSYIFLGGKCRNCKKPISWRYPLIELSTGIGFLVIFRLTGDIGLAAIAVYFALFCLLELIFIIDLEHQIIPDDFIFVGLAGIIFYTILFTPASFFPALFSGLLVATLLMLVHLFTKGRGMGLGDVKFAVLGGMLVGLNLSLIWLFVAFLTGGLAGIILILSRRAGLKDKIAFGPFLVAAIPITLVWGQKIITLMGLR
jgi:prepilin signal peptidase PulO-like enzyme (type II secretory pathway)